MRRVVIGSTAPAASADFLAAFDFVVAGTRRIEADEAMAVYGLAGPLDATVMVAAHAPGGPTLELIPTSSGPSPRRGWDAGPAALDVYVRDLDVAVEMLASRGLSSSAVGGISMGSMAMRQVMVEGPEGLGVVPVESTHRRSSVLDSDPSASFSEPHSVVWVVDDHDSEVAAWTRAGWTPGVTISFEEPSISEELDLPDSPTKITMTMFSDPDAAAMRVELMTFDDHSSPRRRDGDPGAPLPAGIAALVHVVDDTDDMEETARRWGSHASFGDVVTRTDGTACRSGVTAGGIRFVIESAAARD